MARIRSVHPGLFTDEAFVSCHPLARLLLLGLWTESDDNGVFEWKPVTMKMRLLAAEATDVPELLGDLTAFNLVKKVDIDGKACGLVRNFCIWQRPRKPTYRVDLPQQYWTYVGLNADGSRPNALASLVGTEPVPNHSVTGTASRPQMEDVGGKKEGKEKNPKQIDKPVVVVVPPNPETPAGTTTTKAENGLVVQETQPQQPNSLLGTALSETWVPDEPCIAVAHDHGMTDADIDGEVLRFHALNAQRGTFSQNWNKTWTLWCAEFKRRKDSETVKAAPRVEVNATHKATPEEWRAAIKRWKANNSHWSRHLGPEPGMSGCRCPAIILTSSGIDPITGRALPAQVSA